MGQSEVIEFFERMNIEHPGKKFTKEEIETAIRKKIKGYTLKSMYEHGDIKREKESVKIDSGGETRRYTYNYIPKELSVTNFKYRKSSAIPDFYNFSVDERIKIISEFCNLKEEEKRMFEELDVKDLIGENTVSIFPKFLGFANYFKINNRDFFIPYVTEETSVIAGACYGAKLCYDSGGIKASVVESKEYSKAIGQVQLVNVKNPEDAMKKILERKDKLLKKARKDHRHSKPYDLSIKKFENKSGNMLIADLHVNPKDAMGAAVASDMADSIAEELSNISGAEEYSRGIISNYSGRLTKARMKVPIEKLARKSRITGNEWSGQEVARGILRRSEWAKVDIERAVTNNKGIMNDVISVAEATAQDTRAIEAANSVYAIRNGGYQPLSDWYASGEYLYGELNMLIPCGIVGGEIKNYPMAKFLIDRVLKLKSADQLAEIMTSAGLAGNLAALSMNSTVGLKEGHKPLRK
jgi:hydroxymethylglutaryl-CoA reductase